MRCDVLAQGVINAAKEINLNIPLVVRLAGTNFKEGKAILDQSGFKILSATDLNDAAKKVIEAHKGKLLIESRINKGSKFTLKLPIKRDRD